MGWLQRIKAAPGDTRSRALVLFLSFVYAGALLTLPAGCSSSGTSRSIATVSPSQATAAGGQPTAAPVENSPAGDIPDNQTFVSYHSAAGRYSLQVPEGWARTESGPSATFDNKLQSIGVEITSAAAAPTIDTVSANEVPQLQRQVQAFEQIDLKAVHLASGPAVLLRYRANSAPDAVTGKTTRVEVDRYEVFKNGQVAAISLSAPAGSDNVDIWNQISGSFAWD